MPDRRARHFLLITATPHNGKEQDFRLFTALLDADRFEGRFRAPIPGDHIKAEGMAGRIGARLMAVVAQGKGGRVYVEPTEGRN